MVLLPIGHQNKQVKEILKTNFWKGNSTYTILNVKMMKTIMKTLLLIIVCALAMLAPPTRGQDATACQGSHTHYNECLRFLAQPWESLRLTWDYDWSFVSDVVIQLESIRD